jgi:deoxyribose-phosphate aldolase
MDPKPSIEAAARIALRCLDLTSLNDGDDEAGVARLCARAHGAHGDVAAVCVWPRLAAFARSQLPTQIAVAAVANFPAGGADIEAALREVRQIVDAGAQEVDVVLPWRALRDGDAAAADALLRAVREASAGLRLKVILESGELRDETLITRASQLALAAGADMLKTSTGKTAIGATPAAAELMLRAIVAHPAARARAGLKVSGGIRRVADALPYIGLCSQHLGEGALRPQRFGETWQPPRFRIGASSLLDDIEAVLGGTAAPAAEGGY